MSKRAQAVFEIKSWDEKPYAGLDGGPKFTRASVTKSFDGDIVGEGLLEYLMFYHGDGSASFVGLEHVVGRIGDRLGSFVLQHGGTFEGGAAKASWSVVHGSGTGDLRGLRGQGGFASAHAQNYAMMLDYDFEQV